MPYKIISDFLSIENVKFGIAFEKDTKKLVFWLCQVSSSAVLNLSSCELFLLIGTIFRPNLSKVTVPLGNSKKIEVSFGINGDLFVTKKTRDSDQTIQVLKDDLLNFWEYLRSAGVFSELVLMKLNEEEFTALNNACLAKMFKKSANDYQELSGHDDGTFYEMVSYILENQFKRLEKNLKVLLLSQGISKYSVNKALLQAIAFTNQYVIPECIIDSLVDYRMKNT